MCTTDPWFSWRCGKVLKCCFKKTSGCIREKSLLAIESSHFQVDTGTGFKKERSAMSFWLCSQLLQPLIPWPLAVNNTWDNYHMVFKEKSATSQWSAYWMTSLRLAVFSKSGVFAQATWRVPDQKEMLSLASIGAVCIQTFSHSLIHYHPTTVSSNWLENTVINCKFLHAMSGPHVFGLPLFRNLRVVSGSCYDSRKLLHLPLKSQSVRWHLVYLNT